MGQPDVQSNLSRGRRPLRLLETLQVLAYGVRFSVATRATIRDTIRVAFMATI